LFEETLYQKADDGTPLVEKLLAKGIIPGIKVRRYLQEIAPFPACRLSLIFIFSSPIILLTVG
jgi:fructose-bisphosphate aldolase class I